MNLTFNEISRQITQAFGSSIAFILAIILIVGWIIGGIFWYGFGEVSQLYINSITTIVVFLAVFCIQSSQNRDMKTINLKLDELIRAKGQANNSMISIESLSDEQLVQLEERYRKIAEQSRLKEPG